MFTDELRKMVSQLNSKAENAYCEYINLCRADACLGFDAKVENGIFGMPELNAHKASAEKLGRYRALNEAASMLQELYISATSQ